MYQPPNKQKNEGTNIYERIEHPSEEQEELSKMAGEDVSETLRFAELVCDLTC